VVSGPAQILSLWFLTTVMLAH